MLTLKERKTGSVIAAGEQEKTVREFEGNWYFAPEVVDMSHLVVSERTYRCPYKGICYWIDLETPEGVARNVGWVYREPMQGYEFIKDQIGFYARTTAAIESSQS